MVLSRSRVTISMPAPTKSSAFGGLRAEGHVPLAAGDQVMVEGVPGPLSVLMVCHGGDSWSRHYTTAIVEWA